MLVKNYYKYNRFVHDNNLQADFTLNTRQSNKYSHPSPDNQYGYYWITGRTDDVIKVSGYRLGSAEIESVMARHPAIVESVAIALPHPLKGNAIHISESLGLPEGDISTLDD